MQISFSTSDSLLIAALSIISARAIFQEFLNRKNVQRLKDSNHGYDRGSDLIAILWFISLIGALIAPKTNEIITSVGYSISALFGAIGFIASKQLGRFYLREIEICNDHKIIQTGLFCIVRHPIRLGILGESLGFAIVSENNTVIASSLILFILVLYRNDIEDKMLEKTLKKDAIIYQSSVPSMNLIEGLLSYLKLLIQNKFFRGKMTLSFSQK